MKKTSKYSVIIFGACAVIWSFKTVLDMIDRINLTSTLTLVMDAICAVLWIAAFIIQLRKYRKEKKEQ